MKLANQARRFPRKALGVYLTLGLSILGAAASSASIKQPIFTSIGPGLQSNQETPVPSGSQATPSTTENTTFQLRLISDGILLCPKKDLNCRDKDIWWKSFTLFASDGYTLYLTSIPFPSVEQSKKHFELSIKKAEKILRRDSESNSKGEPMGERVLGLFPEIADRKAPWGVKHYQLFWMWGPQYWEITGEHLEDVLALEKRLNEEGTGAVWRWR
jgi:hypothetical protein